MKKSLHHFLALFGKVFCVAVVAPVLAGSTLGGFNFGSSGFGTSARSDDRSLPMRFELRQEADKCGSNCRSLISASGAITADTPRDFKQFTQSLAARGQSIRGATVVLDSDGGSTLGAIALGRDIRKEQLATTVGRVIDLSDKTETPAGEPRRGRVSGVADCESMCAFVMLGGIKRSVPPDARVMVHQIWLGDRREDPTASAYSAEDLVLVQRDIGKLAMFTAEMGGGMDLLDLALRIPPWEPLHIMTRDEIVRSKLSTDANEPVVAAVTPAPQPAARQPDVVTDGVKPKPITLPISERSWSLINNDTGEALARRHPLTVEGDRIGSFDLMLVCGAEGKFELSYIERRQSAGGIALPKQIENVRLRVGRQEAILKIVSSERHESGELRTLAMGAVPVELMKKFVESSRSIVVETTSAGMATVIRLGNTGAPQNFPRLVSACSKPASERADTALLQKTGGLAPANGQ